MRYANHIPYPHWQGEPPGHGVPIHPSRQILDNPPIYEFGEPIGGTYPISYDPSYWYEGVKLDYNLNELLPLVISNALVYYDLFLRQLGPIVASLLILLILSYTQQRSLSVMVRNWNLALISILTFVLYTLVYVEGRYIAVFIVLLTADLLANLSLPDERGYRKLITAASLVMILFLLGSLAVNNLEGYSKLASNTEQQSSSQEGSQPTWPGEVSEELQQFGIRPEDPVGVIGYAFDSFWARLARVKIVAEMIKEDAIPLWYGDAVMQEKVIEAFQSSGAKAIVAEEVPNDASLNGWHRVGKSNYFILQLNP